jgi:hypothetical protein
MRRLLVALLLLLVAAPAAFAHKANPNFLSEIKGLQPATEGVRLEMLRRDDAIELENRSNEDIVVMGYEGDEPYVRLKADGTVEVNTNSKAYYLNEDRFGTVEVPKTLPSEPAWKKLSGSHRFEWHDHRAHYMGKGTPSQVKDPDARTKVFDWEIPVQVGGSRAAITGTLFWTPRGGGGAPTGAIIAGAAIVILLSIMVVVVRRRRGNAAPSGEATEAW